MESVNGRVLFFFFREAKKRRIEKTGAQREDGKRKGERIA